MKSNMPSSDIVAIKSSIYGRSVAVNAVRIRTTSRCSSSCSSRKRLPAATTSAGSIYTVLPEADSSCTMPGILRLFIGATGITIRPSRIAGVVSLSINPSLTADAMTRRMRVLRVPDIEARWRRMSAKAGEALSATSPQRSRMRLMSATTAG